MIETGISILRNAKGNKKGVRIVLSTLSLIFRPWLAFKNGREQQPHTDMMLYAIAAHKSPMRVPLSAFSFVLKF